MFDQLAVFTPQGQVLYQYNCLGKKFSEIQINSFISQLITSPVTRKESVANANTDGFDFNLLTINSEHKNSPSFNALFYLNKQPELYFVVTFAEQTLELNQETQQTLALVLKLWNSLHLSESILKNLQGQNEKNKHNYVDILQGIEDDLKKFEQYFRIKYEESIKQDHINPDNFTKNGSVPQSHNKNTKKKLRDTKGKKQCTGNVGSGRKWGRDGGMLDEMNHEDAAKLDFSSSNSHNSSQVALDSTINKDSFGDRTEGGDFLIKEIDDLLSSHKDEITSGNEAKNSGYVSTAFGFLQKHVLGNKTINESDLKSVLEKLTQQLITKNVAPEAADYLTQQVSHDLVGSKTANWTSVENTARESLTKALTQILTPGVSVDLLREIQSKRSKKDEEGKCDPYVFSIVGVNGVGKSTNLSKLAFWLLQNNFKVLIVACDTFRSGAVEQLRVHVENLAQLMDDSHVRGSKNKRGKTGNDYVELFEAGYGGSDLVTKIAKQAIKYSRDQNFDIVLMDTAGRRHNDPTLMSPLKSFADQAKPDKIIMVGEALVGTDSVQQAKNFNDAFGKGRNLDFFIISKCDTVGEMLGTMVNMVYATGIPILFVGVGQTYTDLRTLSVKWAVNTLMS
ncbi:Srp101p [Saccharomyces cerevisiae YJM451]|nr:Srp101p [Saccharomyces cerevisiae YJM451]PTN18940.1 Signal recognition particle receptor subunit alpha [Saccharomyces cerevisiae]PTN19892.1 Signal recognition particle receptor subunit alpha [Saccharomyces cerevisiae]PTN36149.1 Signal recognition particle receptor subunit alpha [Saccharomyces cerevisiae]CAI4353697.1 AFI_G0011330.mRNA.1.CDS.1 [Saccharomyces cerevisiae]